MRQLQATAFGGPEVLTVTTAPDPTAGPGEVLVRTAAVDTITLDVMLRQAPTPWFDLAPPYVPGSAVVGTVEAVGSDVDPALVGAVVAVGLVGATGASAELVAADADLAVAVPDGVDAVTAAALISDGTTAYALLDDIAIPDGATVLVLGANGGMGLLLVQRLAAAGVRVLGGARGAAKLKLVREAGAVPVDVTDPGWIDRVRSEFGPVDVLLDGVGGALGEAAFALVADGGTVSAHGAPSGDFAVIDADAAAHRGITVRGIADLQVRGERGTALLRRVLADAAGGRLRPVVGETFPLEHAARAHAAIEDRSLLGKVVLTV